MKRLFLTPSPMHSGMRLIDLVAVLAVCLVGLGVRLAWDSNWALLTFPLAVMAARWTHTHIRSIDPEEQITNPERNHP